MQRRDPLQQKLAFGTWNVTSLGEINRSNPIQIKLFKDSNLVTTVERRFVLELTWDGYRLDIVGLTSTHSVSSGAKLLDKRYSLAYSGDAQGRRRQAGVHKVGVCPGG